MEKTYKKINELIEWDKNPRNITRDGFARLIEQIKKLGQYKPLIVTKDGIVLGGNMRLKALKELGIDKVWVSVVEPKDENEMLEYALSDNDRAGFYDSELLANLVPNYEVDWSKFAVDTKEPITIQELLDQFQVVDEDEAPPLDEGNIVSKNGEVYQLGLHRLMCGDSTKLEDVQRLMDGKLADLIFTDPPYNVNYDYNVRYFDGRKKRLGEKWEPILNDKKSSKQFQEFIYKAFSSMYSVSKDSAPFYCWYADKTDNDFKLGLLEAGWHISQVLVWLKENITFSTGQDYHRIYEPCFFGWKKGNQHFVNKSFSKWSELIQLNFDDFLEQLDVIYQNRDKANTYEHPTQKPVRLAERSLKKHSFPNAIVLDVFGGSGSTLVACEQLNRICYTMELNPKFCDVIRKRYARLIGKEAEWQTLTARV